MSYESNAFHRVNLARPYTAVTPTVEGEVLMTLARTSRPLTGREVARLSRRGTQPSVQRALSQLAAHGIVNAQQAGRAILYTLNRDHLAYPAVEILAAIWSELLRLVAKTVRQWKIQPVHASIFGSAARGDGGIDSDIDIFVVRPTGVDEEDATWRRQLDQLTELVWRWTGNRTSISEIGKSELARLKRERPPIVAELESDSVVLAGLSTKELLRGRR